MSDARTAIFPARATALRKATPARTRAVVRLGIAATARYLRAILIFEWSGTATASLFTIKVVASRFMGRGVATS
jgi:hypothetical protein